MHLINRTFQILVVAFFTVPVSAYADSWSCSHENDVREVHIERTTSAPVPCNVVYKKQTEGVEDQILWNADSDEAYCEEKAKGLVAKLESWGWVCAETIADDAGDSGDETEAATGSDDASNSRDEAGAATEARSPE